MCPFPFEVGLRFLKARGMPSDFTRPSLHYGYQ